MNFEMCEKFHGTKGWKSVRYYELNPDSSKTVNYSNSYKITDEEDLDQRYRKQKVEYKDKTDMSYEG
jgi:hypothetical protein